MGFCNGRIAFYSIGEELGVKLVSLRNRINAYLNVLARNFSSYATIKISSLKAYTYCSDPLINGKNSAILSTALPNGRHEFQSNLSTPPEGPCYYRLTYNGNAWALTKFLNYIPTILATSDPTTANFPWQAKWPEGVIVTDELYT